MTGHVKKEEVAERRFRGRVGVTILRVEFKICKKCGKSYTWTRGGIVAGPNDYRAPGLCEKCRAKSITGKIKKIIDIITE